MYFSTDSGSPEPTSEPTSLPPISLVQVQWNWHIMVQLILAIVGISGNSLVIHLFLHTRKLMNSTTNTFIAALAVADLITSISIIPRPWLSRVPDNTFGHFYCKVVFSSNIMWISIVASVFTLTALTIERYIAICLPTRHRNIFTRKSTRVIIIVIWLSSFTINTGSYYVTQLYEGQCTHEFPSQGFQKFLGVSLFLIEYLLPMTIMLVANIRAIFVLQSRARNLAFKTGKAGSANLFLRARRRVILMLLIVVISFIVCWSPDQFAFLVFNLGLVPFHYLFSPLYSAFVVLAFANSCVNPIIYALTNKNFRQAIRQLLPSSMRSRQGKRQNILFETPLGDSGMSSSTKTSKVSSSQVNVSMNSIYMEAIKQ